MQFISYRQLRQWKNACACHIQKCSTWQQLQHLWNAILCDRTKHNKQYENSVVPFLEKLWEKCREAIPEESESLEASAIAPCLP